MTTNPGRSRWKAATRLGWWAVWLMLAYAALYVITMVVIALRLSLPPVYGIIMLLCGLAASVLGLIAIVKEHERSWIVWITLLPGVLVLILVIGEFLFPH